MHSTACEVMSDWGNWWPIRLLVFLDWEIASLAKARCIDCPMATQPFRAGQPVNLGRLGKGGVEYCHCFGVADYNVV